MKILKIHVESDEKGKMVYPPGFTSINCLEHLYYDDVQSGICYLLILIEDKDISKITDLKNVQEIDIAEAEALSNLHNPRTTKITDEGIVRTAEIKSKSGTGLSDYEKKAIDPDDPTPGITWQKTFIDRIKERMGLTS